MSKAVCGRIKKYEYFIRIKDVLFIHPITIVLFAAAYIMGFFKELALLYGVVMVHEAFHILGAILVKTPFTGVKIMPFGVTLMIKNDYIISPEKEIIVAAAGPFANILMILFAKGINSYCLFHTDDMNFFILANMGMLLINLLPALPLDGGRILKAILTMYMGFSKSFSFMRTITKCLIILLILLGGYGLYWTHFNYSVFLIAIFLLYNLIGETNNRNLVMMREIIYGKEKLVNRGIYTVKTIAAVQELPAQRLLKYFDYHHFHLITVIDGKMAVVGTLTEVQIIEGLLAFGTQIVVRDLLEKYNM